MPTNQIIEIDQSNNIHPIDPEEKHLPITKELSVFSKETQNNEITIGFISIEKSWDRNKIIIDYMFSFIVALNIITGDEDPDPKTIEEYRHRND